MDPEAPDMQLDREDQSGEEYMPPQAPSTEGEDPRWADEEDDGAPRWRSSVPQTASEMEEEEDELDAVEGLPLFASEQNKELDLAVKAKEARLESVYDELNETKQRVTIMDEHLKNVQQELLHTQALVDAKGREIETERHLMLLAERETGRYRQELSRLQQEGETAQDKLNMIQNNIFKGNERMDQFKLKMSWNQEELEQWALAAKQKEEDNLALQRYTRADELKIKDLSLQIERLTTLCTDRKVELDNEVTETQAKQIELDKTAEEFRKLHRDRQQLVRQWKDAIEAMQRRDSEIASTAELFASAKQEHNSKLEVLDEFRGRLEAQQAENVEVESKIAVKERALAQLRSTYQSHGGKLTEFKDEVEVIKNELGSAASELSKKRTNNANLARALQEKKVQLEAARKKYHGISRRLESEANASDNVEAAARQAEEDLSQREQDLRRADHSLNALKETMYKESQSLFALRQEEANVIAEISGAQAASRNLSQKIHQLDQSSLRQQELIYNAEFQIQQLERKVARAGGERTGDEKKVLNERIAVLQGELEAVQGQKSMLDAQVKKLGDELRAQRRAFQNAVRERDQLESDINAAELENNSCITAMRQSLRRKEETMVQHDVMRLEVKRLRDILNQRADEVFTLQNRTSQLQLSMEERKKEIAVHAEVQRAQLRAVEEERHRVSMELGERQQRVDKLKGKFETLIKVSGVESADAGEGGERSQAFFVIQAAQRREELQREGDDLDAQIRKAEREIRALENTLRHLTVRNTEFRASFQRADLNSHEAEEMSRLEEAVKMAQDTLFKRKKELQRMQTDYEEDQRRFAQIQEQSGHLGEHNEHLKSAFSQVSRELEEQQEKLVRAQHKVNRYTTDHRRERDTLEVTLDEKVFWASAIRETTNNVLYTLGVLAREFPELQDTLTMELQKGGLHLPSRPPSRVASRQGGARGGGGNRPASSRSDRSDESDRSSVSATSSTAQGGRALAMQQFEPSF